ncbi:MAG: hypothetical protein LBJ78_02640 [Puniceicoccales bacterium]|jgi:hypothetical protein|nr:hypothetical protein [Puniceicoccales bacterium]
MFEIQKEVGHFIKVEIVENIPQKIGERMWEDLKEYDKSSGIDTNYKRFSLIMKNDNEVIGVLEGYTVFAEIYVGELWIYSVYKKRDTDGNCCKN